MWIALCAPITLARQIAEFQARLEPRGIVRYPLCCHNATQKRRKPEDWLMMTPANRPGPEDKRGKLAPAEETLMPKPVLTLAAAWAEFDAMVFDGSVASASKTQAQRVFHGGAQAILDILMAGPEATESDFDRVEALSADLRRFGE